MGQATLGGGADCERPCFPRHLFRKISPLCTRLEAVTSGGKMLGKYEILEPLGKGGIGPRGVFRIRDTGTYRHVAIKLLAENPDSNTDRLGL